MSDQGRITQLWASLPEDVARSLADYVGASVQFGGVEGQLEEVREAEEACVGVLAAHFSKLNERATVLDVANTEMAIAHQQAVHLTGRLYDAMMGHSKGPKGSRSMVDDAKAVRVELNETRAILKDMLKKEG